MMRSAQCDAAPRSDRSSASFAVGDPQRRLQHPARRRRVHLAEVVLAGAAALFRGRPAVRQQLADLRGDPAVADHPALVVVNDAHQRVRFLARVREHANDLVLIAERVGVHVALGRRDLTEV
jgi:hypothetical protein